MDYLTPQQRHKNMAAIHNKNTKPEMIVRKLVSPFFCKILCMNQIVPSYYLTISKYLAKRLLV